MALPDGLYDLLLTEGLTRSLAALDPISVDVLALRSGAAEFLADVITRQLAAILDDVAGDEPDKAKRQLELVNELLVMLRQRINSSANANGAFTSADVVDLVASPLRVLRAVQRDQQFPASPEIGLAVPWLFTAGKGSPSLLQEIRRELVSSDQVDILVSASAVFQGTCCRMVLPFLPRRHCIASGEVSAGKAHVSLVSCRRRFANQSSHMLDFDRREHTCG